MYDNNVYPAFKESVFKLLVISNKDVRQLTILQIQMQSMLRQIGMHAWFWDGCELLVV